MAREADQGERTEEATELRREDFRRRGQVAQTKELSSVLLVFCGVLLVWLASRFFFREIWEIFNRTCGDALVTAVHSGEWRGLAGFAFKKLVLILLPMLVLFGLAGFLSSVVQIGVIYNEEALRIRWERLDPARGLMRLFSLRAVLDGLKTVLKMVVILGLCYLLVRDQVQMLPRLMSFSVPQIVHFLGALTTRLLTGIGLFMLALAALDYLYQRWDLEREMRMTKQEVKEEIKSREGDPLIKARIRSVRRATAAKRMMDQVRKADLVVVNPDHIAVALRYGGHMAAPQVIAKGAERIGERISSIAREHGIHCVENRPLAHAMFKTLEIGQMIPREFYGPVAEAFAHFAPEGKERE
jgi:flagellar biosynthetic protein FlhB